MERDATSKKETAARLGITEKTIRNVVNGQSMVELADGRAGTDRRWDASARGLRVWYDAEAAA